MPVYLQLKFEDEEPPEPSLNIVCFPGTKIPMSRYNIDKIPNVSRAGDLTHYIQNTEKVEYRWSQMWNVGIAAGWKQQIRRLVIKESWDERNGSKDRLNYKREEIVIQDWSLRHNNGTTEAVTFGWIPAEAVDQWIIKPPAGLKIGFSVPIPDKTPSNRQSSKILVDDSDKITLDKKQATDITKHEMSNDVYDKFVAPVTVKSSDQDAFYLGFKSYVIGSKIDPLTVKGWAKSYEGDLIQQAIREGKQLVVADVEMLETKTSKNLSNGVTITYCDYLIMLGLIDSKSTTE